MEKLESVPVNRCINIKFWSWGQGQFSFSGQGRTFEWRPPGGEKELARQ